MKQIRFVPVALLLVVAAWPVAAALALAEKDVPPNTAASGGLAAEAAEATTVVDGFAEPLGPLEKQLFCDASDGRLDAFSLLGAALIASGVQSAETLQRYESRQAAWIDELCRMNEPAGSPRQQAQVVLEFMHERILQGGYSLDSTDLRAVLDEGRYNCVSASVLFQSLAGEVGLGVCGLEIPGHAMSRVALPDAAIDVETTCPRWFRLSGDPRHLAEMVQETIGRDPAEDRSQAREISPVQMTAMIYYNRGVDFLAKGQFHQAAAANAKALWLDPASATARGNLLATVNNWAIALGTSQHYAEAIVLLRRGLAIDPLYAPFEVNYVHVHHQWVEHLCSAERFEEALDLLHRTADERPQCAYFRQAALELYGRWARALFERGEPDQAFALFAEAGRRHGECRALIDAEVAAVTQYGLTLLEHGRVEEAVALFDRGLARRPDAKLLRDYRREATTHGSAKSFD
ncbi:MAG: tetratricopeptide repeat protein [Pirellulales bacterium]|nr:tetratricopeptide repeat protein [Pirellulales bacterium]